MLLRRKQNLEAISSGPVRRPMKVCRNRTYPTKRRQLRQKQADTLRSKGIRSIVFETRSNQLGKN